MNTSDTRSRITSEKTDGLLVATLLNRFSVRVAKSRLLLGLTVVAAALCDRTPAAAQMIGYPVQGNWSLVYDATGTDELHDHANNVRSLYFDVDSSGNTIKKVFMNFQANKDYAPYPYFHGTLPSSSWSFASGPDYPNPPVPYETPNVDMMTAIKRIDGTVLAIPFRPVYPGGSFTYVTFGYHTSTNNGTSWTSHPDTGAGSGQVNFPQTVVAWRFHRGMIEEPNGSGGSDLYAVGYTAYAPQDKILPEPNGYTIKYRYRSVVVKSTDGGAVWNMIGTIGTSTTSKYTETAISRCYDGSWLAMMRQEDYDSQPLQMKQSRSTDKGLTWSAPINPPGMGTPTLGVDPTMMLMPNGILVLSYGIQNAGTAGRNTKLAFSPDGNGNSWTGIVETFTAIDNSNESTGYTALVPVNAHRFIQVTDTGISWSYSSQWPGGNNPYQLKQKLLDVVLTRRNRIDLATRLNPATDITTDLTYSNALHPEARVTGAFDGSTDYWSGAFKSGTTGSYTVDLGEIYNINTIGVCLHQSISQSANVQFSTNGSTWTTMQTYTNATHSTVKFANVTPTDARFVRVNITGSSGSMACLNELELYAINDTYENAIPGILPYGYTTTGGAWIREGVPPLPNGYKSQRGLYLVDGDSATKSFSRAVSAQATKTLEFRVKPVAFGASGSIQVHLKSGATIGFRLMINSLGELKWYNGSTYTVVTGASVPTGSWTKIKVVAVATSTTDTATVWVNGTQMGATGSIGRENNISTMNDVTFSSGGLAITGDEAYFDDIYITP